MKQTRTVALVSGFVLLLLLLAGCGTIDVNFHTTVKPSGDLVQEFRVDATGMIGSSLGTPEVTEDLKSQGWDVSIERSGDSASLIAKKDFKRGETPIIPSLSLGTDEATASEETRLESLNFDVRDRLLFKEYTFEMTLPGSPASTETDAEGQFPQLDKAMEEALKAMFSISWTVSLPGTIVETNADSTSGGSATWNFDFASMGKDQHLAVRTRYIKWPIIGGLVALVFIIIAGGVAFALMRSRQPKVGTS